LAWPPGKRAQVTGTSVSRELSSKWQKAACPRNRLFAPVAPALLLG
jgi:hypothetical protein